MPRGIPGSGPNAGKKNKQFGGFRVQKMPGKKPRKTTIQQVQELIDRLVETELRVRVGKLFKK